ncbi:MAG: hypothetical protein WEK74_10205, partial [Hydrogenophaga sp.]
GATSTPTAPKVRLMDNLGLTKKWRLGGPARAGKEDQRSQSAPRRLNRVGSAFTQQVIVSVVNSVSVHGHRQRTERGQLPFLGSTARKPWKNPKREWLAKWPVRPLVP